MDGPNDGPQSQVQPAPTQPEPVHDLQGCLTQLASQVFPWIVFAGVSVLLVAMFGGYLAGRFAPLGAGLVAFGGGYLCYCLRERKRVLYGCFEIASGVGIAVFSVWNASKREVLSVAEFFSHADGLLVVVALVSSIFLVVRGLDNYHQGLQNWGKPIPKQEGCQTTGIVLLLGIVVLMAAVAGIVVGYIDRR